MGLHPSLDVATTWATSNDYIQRSNYVSSNVVGCSCSIAHHVSSNDVLHPMDVVATSNVIGWMCYVQRHWMCHTTLENVSHDTSCATSNDIGVLHPMTATHVATSNVHPMYIQCCVTHRVLHPMTLVCSIQ